MVWIFLSVKMNNIVRKWNLNFKKLSRWAVRYFLKQFIMSLDEIYSSMWSWLTPLDFNYCSKINTLTSLQQFHSLIQMKGVDLGWTYSFSWHWNTLFGLDCCSSLFSYCSNTKGSEEICNRSLSKLPSSYGMIDFVSFCLFNSGAYSVTWWEIWQWPLWCAVEDWVGCGYFSPALLASFSLLNETVKFRERDHLHHCFSKLLCCDVLSRSVMSESLRHHGLYPARILCPWGFSRQEYGSGLPCPLSGALPNPGTEPMCPSLQVDSLPSEPPGKPKNTGVGSLSLLQGNLLTQESNWGLLHCRQIL